MAILTELSNGMADAVERISPALVTVDARRRQPASGVVIGNELVITADHVIEREEDIHVVTHDGRKLPATFAGRDPATDLALLRVPGLNLDAAQQAESVKVGQFLLAVGRPSAEGVMASLGIVSAVGGPLRTRRGGMVEQYIRTDAIPYPGFSGGALISAEGTVLGILTTGLAGGVAIGIPATHAWRTGDTLAQHGHVKKGFLGVTSQPVRLPEAQRGGLSQSDGLLIMRVEPDSPAEKGGVMLGDILISLDGANISDAGELQALLTGARVGTTVPVVVIRGGTATTLNVTIGVRK